MMNATTTELVIHASKIVHPGRRKVASSSVQAVSDLETRVLDATLELALAVGPTWTTLSEVARRSRVSRATIYRKWSNVEAIFIDVLSREYLNIAVEVMADDEAKQLAGHASEETKRDRLVIALQIIASRIEALPLLKSLIEHDPASIVRVMFLQRHPAFDQLIEMLELVIAQHGDDGTIRQDDIPSTARSVVLSLTAFVMTGPIIFNDEADRQRALVDTLRRLLTLHGV